jgi:SET domain-containing protein
MKVPNAATASIPLTRAGGLCMVLDTPKGRGVFATQKIPIHSIIEVCPVLVLPLDHLPAAKTTLLDHYTYNWPTFDKSKGKEVHTQAVVLGLGSLFNHSTHNQNVGWKRNVKAESIDYMALRDIEPGEEL